jgi:hypothetical protein
MSYEDVMVDKPRLLVNPNDGRPFKATVYDNGKRHDIKFEPFRRKRMPSHMAKQVLSFAAESKRMAAIQAQAEEDQYRELSSRKDDLGAIALAKRKFVNPDDGLPPKTRPWPYDPVVDLTTKSGMAEFEKAIKEYGKDVDLEEDDVREREEIAMPKFGIAPEVDWDKMDIYNWVIAEGGTASTNQDIEPLYDRAFRIVRRLSERLAKRNVVLWDTEFDCPVRFNADRDRILWPKEKVRDAKARKSRVDPTG